MRSFQDCCRECDERLECFIAPVPTIQAIAMVEVTKEMRKYSIQFMDVASQQLFRQVYGNLIANVKEDINGIHGDY